MFTDKQTKPIYKFVLTSSRIEPVTSRLASLSQLCQIHQPTSTRNSHYPHTQIISLRNLLEEIKREAISTAKSHIANTWGRGLSEQMAEKIRVSKAKVPRVAGRGRCRWCYGVSGGASGSASKARQPLNHMFSRPRYNDRRKCWSHHEGIITDPDQLTIPMSDSCCAVTQSQTDVSCYPSARARTRPVATCSVRFKETKRDLSVSPPDRLNCSSQTTIQSATSSVPDRDIAANNGIALKVFIARYLASIRTPSCPVIVETIIVFIKLLRPGTTRRKILIL
ncbi:hypothetical protein J6590_096266 [Homalodisca vitripennis]|nr:hypothetical protein J6590_031350 [Homalodisca vitripennis]KAG8334180.1 hypothetical protein J6590_096266 [Homalodisca vitripennis]